MKKIAIPLLILGMCFSSNLPAQRTDTAGSAALFQRIMSEINPKHVNWIKNTAVSVNQKKQGEAEIKTAATNYAVLGNLNNSDIEALCFLVLMQAAKSAREDLKSIMGRVKAINEEKKELRDAQDLLSKKQAISRRQLDSLKRLFSVLPNAIQRSGTTLVKKRQKIATDSAAQTWSRVHSPEISKAEMDNTVEKLQNDLDAMSEMGEMESLRLQMAMDRMSKMMSTLSNLLKKISDTAQTITQNLK